MKVLALIRNFNNRCLLLFKNNRWIYIHILSSIKVSGLVKKFKVKISHCVEVSDDSVCSSIMLPLNSYLMFKRNTSSSSLITSLPIVSTRNSDNISFMISDESVLSSDVTSIICNESVLSSNIEFPILSCVDVKIIDCSEIDSNIDNLNNREKECDDFRTIFCLQMNYQHQYKIYFKFLIFLFN